MEPGQVAEQPTPFGSDAEAQQAALAILRKDPEFAAERSPRDEAGKFTKAQAEAAPEPEVKPEPEEKAEAQPEEKVEEEEKPALKFKVKYKGDDDSDVEAEVEPDELIKGYMLQKDYSRKTAQLAREREAVQSKVKEAVEPKLKEYESGLETYKQLVMALADREGANVDLNKLAETDPAQAQKLFFKRLEFNNALQAINQAQQKVQMQRTEEAQKALRKAAEEAREQLQVRIPGWDNELYSKILRTGKDYGFKDEEVKAFTDARAIEVLHDAMKWREFKAAKPKAEEKKKVDVPKVVKPGTTERSDPNADKVKASKDRLRKTGRVEDALDWAKQILAE